MGVSSGFLTLNVGCFPQFDGINRYGIIMDNARLEYTSRSGRKGGEKIKIYGDET